MNISKNAILAAIGAVAVIIIGIFIFGGQNLSKFSIPGFGPSKDEIAKKSIEYLNTNVLSGQSQATLESTTEESGVIKFKLKVGGQEYESYATKDGKLLFPQAFKMESSSDKNNEKPAASAQTCESLPKSDKPVLEAYIVSRCPFGLQMQRMMADAIKNIPELAGYVEARYIGEVSGNTITAMHGEAEAKENLRQICIREEQPAKYWNYVACQMKGANAEVSCEKSAGVDSAKLSACTSDPKRGVAFAKADFDLATKYGATGSPTLVMGGTTVEEFDSAGKGIFGGRSSDEIRQIVCCASKNQPSFCSKKLSTDQAASSFSATYASANNSGSSGTNCEPAQ